jgi:hypothetical protein
MFKVHFLRIGLLVCASSVMYASDDPMEITTNTTTTNSTYITTTTTTTATTNSTYVTTTAPAVAMRKWCTEDTCRFSKQDSSCVERFEYPRNTEQIPDDSEKFIFGNAYIPYFFVDMAIADQEDQKVYVMSEDYIPLRDKAIAFFTKKQFECNGKYVTEFLEYQKLKLAQKKLRRKERMSEDDRIKRDFSRRNTVHTLRTTKRRMRHSLELLNAKEKSDHPNCTGIYISRRVMMLLLQVKALQDAVNKTSAVSL